MRNDKSAKPPENSYTLVIIVSFVIAVLMPFVRVVATGETEAAAAYTSAVPVSVVHPSLSRGGGADEVSLLVVGVFLLGLGSVLRRAA
jgi:hypothetical protein